MATCEASERRAHAREVQEYARSKGLKIEPGDLEWSAEMGQYLIDGMDPADWIDAMTME